MDMAKEIVHITRLMAGGKYDDAATVAKRAVRRIVKERPDLASEANEILNSITNAAMIRSAQAGEQPLPVDLDSRLELLRRELNPFVDSSFLWPEPINSELIATIEERNKNEELLRVGLSPTKSLLFVGPPGVGKTVAAQWIAAKLKRPLLTLDLSAVMSSYLGRTGGNIRTVLDYARKIPCVLLLDEFDAIAKRRDDTGEIGELKRLVTVLLQEVDSWPDDGLLIAATNHPELLDPAVWRRFEKVLNFPYPSLGELTHLINNLLGDDLADQTNNLSGLLGAIFIGNSFAEVTRQINALRKNAVLSGTDTIDVLEAFIVSTLENADKAKKIQIAVELAELGYVQRRIQEITGISRDTVRRHWKLAKAESRQEQ